MSSSLIFNNERVSSVLRSKVGRLFEFCNRVHGDAKHLLKIHAFLEKLFLLISPLTSKVVW